MAQQRRKHAEVRDLHNLKCREYYAANAEKVKQKQAEYRESHRDDKNAYMRDYQAANKEALRERKRVWRRANPQKAMEQTRAKRARLKAATGSHTAEEWRQIIARQGDRCAICRDGCKLEKDHIVPLSRGGSNYASNLQALCKSCNSRKSNKLESAP